MIATGCCVGDDCLNHLIYADDICCFSPSIEGLQELINLCSDYHILMKSHLMLRRLLVLFFLLKKLKGIRPLLFFFRALKLNFLIK